MAFAAPQDADEVDDGVLAGHHQFELVLVEDVGLLHGNRRQHQQVLGTLVTARRHVDVDEVLCQPFREMGSDKPGAADQEDVHGRSLAPESLLPRGPMMPSRLFSDCGFSLNSAA